MCTFLQKYKNRKWSRIHKAHGEKMENCPLENYPPENCSQVKLPSGKMSSEKLFY